MSCWCALRAPHVLKFQSKNLHWKVHGQGTPQHENCPYVCLCVLFVCVVCVLGLSHNFFLLPKNYPFNLPHISPSIILSDNKKMLVIFLYRIFIFLKFVCLFFVYLYFILKYFYFTNFWFVHAVHARAAHTFPSASRTCPNHTRFTRVKCVFEARDARAARTLKICYFFPEFISGTIQLREKKTYFNIFFKYRFLQCSWCYHNR